MELAYENLSRGISFSGLLMQICQVQQEKKPTFLSGPYLSYLISHTLAYQCLIYWEAVSDTSKRSPQNGGVNTNIHAGALLLRCAATWGHFALEEDWLLL